jgi:hypothetical protein
MLTRGVPPFLECSTHGTRRLSAFYARPRSLNGKSIEEAYQAMKVLPDGRTGLSWRKAKGKRAINQSECVAAYERWWREYLDENPDLMRMICSASGLSDMFGREGSVCQAEVLWRIREEQRAAKRSMFSQWLDSE